MKKSTTGFTIVELLIVIVVIAILAAISVVAYTGIQDRARTSAHASAASQTEKEIMTYALQQNSESISLSNTIIGYREGGGAVALLRPLTNTPDITMYVVQSIISISGNYPYLARLTPSNYTNNVFQLNTGATGSSQMGYRIDTQSQNNVTSYVSGVRVPGNTVIGWLQVSNNATSRSYGYNQAVPQQTASLSAHTGWEFTDVELLTNADTTGRVVLVFNAAHDQTTRQQVISWLAQKYGVSL